MNIVLLSGGSGKRLWPLSNDNLSKQFLKLLRNEKGEHESMVQRVMRQIRDAWPDANVVVSCNKDHLEMLERQLGRGAEIVAEPARRDTFPAIVYAAAWLRHEKNLPEDTPFVVCPIDVFAERRYFELLGDVASLTDRHSIGLMGAIPTYPSAKYGYILRRESHVIGFVEKPEEKKAEALIESGALWNCGVFGLKIGYVLEKAVKHVDSTDFQAIRESFDRLPAASFDYEVVESESSIGTVVYEGTWKDLGTWNTLTEEMSSDTLGYNVLVSDESKNVHVLNMLNIPVVVQDVHDAVVIASHDGVLVSSKHGSSFLKPLAEQLSTQPMYGQRLWGNYRVLDDSAITTIKRVKIDAGKIMDCREQHYRSEVWVVTKGKGILSIDGMDSVVSAGSVVELPGGAVRYLLAATDMEVVEINLLDI